MHLCVCMPPAIFTSITEREQMPGSLSNALYSSSSPLFYPHFLCLSPPILFSLFLSLGSLFVTTFSTCRPYISPGPQFLSHVPLPTLPSSVCYLRGPGLTLACRPEQELVVRGSQVLQWCTSLVKINSQSKLLCLQAAFHPLFRQHAELFSFFYF